MPHRIQVANRIALAIALTFVMAGFSFVDDMNSHVAGTNEQITQLARGIWLILIPVSLVAWIRVFLIWPSWRASLIILSVAGMMCFYSYFGVGFASDVFIGTPKPTYANGYVIELASYGATTVAFFVLFIASLIVIVYRIWSRQKKSPGPISN